MHERAPVKPETAERLQGWPELLTLPQAAQVLGRSAEWVAAAAASGDLPAKRLGGDWRILRCYLATDNESGVSPRPMDAASDRF